MTSMTVWSMLMRPTSGRTLTAHQQTEAVAELAIEAVGISYGDERKAHGLGGDEGAVVADDRAGRDGSHTRRPGISN